MAIDPQYLLYGALFLCVLFLVEGLYLLAAGQSRQRRAVNRRQRLLAGGAGREEALATLLRRDGGQTTGLAVRLAALAPLRAVDRLLAQAGVRLPLGRALACAAALAVAGGFAVWNLLGGMLPVVPAGALAAGVGLPLGLLLAARRQRLKRFGAQLPDALDVIVRSLRAGHPVVAAIKLVGEQMPDPIGSEFGVVVDEMTYGLELREALERLAQRVGHPELGLVTIAIKIQHQSGGNLAEVLSGLSRTVRARAQMQGKVSALSAEGRLSAILLTVLPFLVAGGISVVNPDYFGQISGDPLTLPILGMAGGGLLVGILMVWRMINLRV